MHVAHLCTLFIVPRWRRDIVVPTDNDDAPGTRPANQQYPITLRKEIRCHITRTGPHPRKQRIDQCRLDGGCTYSTRLRDPEYDVHNLAAQYGGVN